MSTIRIIAHPRTILGEVASHLTDNVDFTRALVVFPGRRPSHVLRTMLASRRNKGFLPPRIFSYDEFIQHISREHLGMQTPDLDPLDAAALLYEVHSERTERLGGPHFQSFDEFLPLGLRLFDELEELLLAGADVRSIAKQVGGLTFGNRHLLSVYFEEFYRLVREQKLSTRSTRLSATAQAIREVDLSGYEKIILAGFYALTPTDRILFKELAGREQVILIFGEGRGLQRQLELLDLGGTSEERSQMDLFGGVGSEEEGGSVVESEMHFYKSTDIHGQVFALSALIQSLHKNHQLDERTAIVLPSSDALFPVLYQTLALLPEEGYNISLGYPLSRTPLYALLSSLLDLIAGAENGTVQTSSYVQCVLHPYIKNIRHGNRTDVTRVLFHALEDQLARRPATTVSLDSLEAENILFDRIARGLSDEVETSGTELKAHLKSIHQKVIRPFLTPGTLGEFAGKLGELVIFVNKESTAYLHPLFSRYAEKMLEITESIKMSAASSKRFEQVTSYATFLQSYIGPQTVPFPGTPFRGLQVLGLLETRALSFDRVFVLDASDDVLPGARGTEMLVPQGMRESLGLETYKDREALIEYYFTNLVNGAKEVHLFFTENNKKEKSRFVEKLLWTRMQQKRRDEVQLARYRIHLGNADPLPVKKSKSVAAFLKEFEFSTTALDEYLKCQLRFYYRYVLGLKERQEVGDEVEQMDIGTLVHRVLKAYFDPLLEKQISTADIDVARMVRVTEETIAQVFGSNRGAIYLLKQQTVSKMKEFLEEYQKKILEGQSVKITALEREYSIVKEGHHFSGRIDRVEERDGRTVILDYKIRQDDTPYKVSWRRFDPKDRATWSDTIGSLQLPMYSLLFAEQTGQPITSIVPVYLFLGRNYIDKTIETGLTKDGSITEDMHRNLHRVILTLAAEIKDEAVPFNPADDIKKTCPGCPYQTLCGTQWAREGRW